MMFYSKLNVKIPKGFFKPAISYVLEFLFDEEISITEDSQDSKSYSFTFDGETIMEIPASDFLNVCQSSELLDKKVSVRGEGKEFELFHTDESRVDGPFNFDLIAATFYLLSGIQEMQAKEFDAHGRPKSQDNILVKQRAEAFPIVDLWKKLMHKELSSFPRFSSNADFSFQWWNTFDIDQTAAIADKTFFKQLAQLLKKGLRLQFLDLKKLTLALVDWKKDPFLVDLSSFRLGNRNLVFFQLGNQHRLDNCRSVKSKSFQYLLKEATDAGFEIGLHPSYLSSEKESLLIQEYQSLLASVGEIKSSRQHYLRMKWPNTLRSIEKLGVSEEFSAGFADIPGFRFGSSRPFYFFDVQKGCKTNLKIVPFSVMDVSLRFYQKMSVEEANKWLSKHVADIKKCGGQLCTLWHNESLANLNDWGQWQEVYFTLHQLSQPYED